MGRIFLYVGEAGAINEAVEDALIRIGNLVADELRSRGFRVLDVPDELELTEAIAWINLIHCMGKRFWRFSDDSINRLVYVNCSSQRFRLHGLQLRSHAAQLPLSPRQSPPLQPFAEQ